MHKAQISTEHAPTELNPCHEGYSLGHPWYFLLGGQIPTPKQIKVLTDAGNHSGYLAEGIGQINRRDEPQRSEKLRCLKSNVESSLTNDLSIYRDVVRDLNRYRALDTMDKLNPICEEVHVSMGLKISHLINGFAHLNSINGLLDQQRDLFGL